MNIAFQLFTSNNIFYRAIFWF